MNNTSVSTCSGTFYDSGGDGSDYGLSENYTKQFCSDNGECLKLDFIDFDLDNSYDFLRIYDGPTTADPLIGVYSSWPPDGPIISSGTCLTITFTSDAWFNYLGWKANISCIEKPACGVNPLASDACSSATSITNLEGYCGNTSASYTVDSPGNIASEFCGSIENNSWIKFTADDTFAEFNIWSSNCTSGNGIQVKVLSTSDCLNFTSVSSCWNPFSEMNSTLTASGLTIGEEYYIMIDGNTGDVCDYTIGGGQGVVVLPVELTQFETKCKNNAILLEWETSAEINTAYFVIEKSMDGKEFYALHQVEAAGNSNSLIHYRYEDFEKNDGLLYYRLKIVDKDGKTKVSEIKSELCNEISGFQIYPNPASNQVSVLKSANQKYAYTVKIKNYLGDLTYTQSFAKTSDNIQIPLTNFASGIYFLTIESNSSIIVHKLIIEK